MRILQVILVITLVATLTAAPGARADGAEAEKLLEHAERAAERGAPALAFEFYRRALEISPAADSELGRRLLQGFFATCNELETQGARSRAVSCLVELLEATAPGKRADQALARQVRLGLERLALRLVMAHQYTPAIGALARLCADSPGTPLRWAVLARAQMEVGAAEDARKTVVRGLAVHPGAPELLFIKALLDTIDSRRAVVRGEFARVEKLLRGAEADLQQALQRAGMQAGIWLSLGKVRLELWRLLQATGRWRQAAKFAGRVEEALAVAALAAPGEDGAAVELADFLMAAGDWREATRWYRWALAHLPAPAAAGGARGKVYRRLRSGLFDALLKGLRGEARAGRQASWRHLLDELRREFPEQRDLLQLVAEWAAGQTPAVAETAGQELAAVERTILRSGPLQVEVEAEAGFDVAPLRYVLPRAQAINQATFPERLYGPLQLRVLPRRSDYLQAVGTVQPAGGARDPQGVLLTWQEPGRGRSSWLQLLTRELARRYIDELSYRRAPRWLSTGLAGWVSRPVDARERRLLLHLAESRRLVEWRALDQALSWPRNRERLRQLQLQARHMAGWLLERFGRERVLVLLAALRAESPLEQAVRHVFGGSLEQLENSWRRSLLAGQP